ncbi:hypothetical protein HQ584_08190 [Patescibacteria group bacterium]|nr:hypothetical protein [Patescibacteria group bacterium]
MFTESTDINTCVWLFGRGAAVASGLKWAEPPEWRSLDRDIRINRIKKSLYLEMRKIPIGKNPYHRLLSILEKRTEPNWKHLFITTNWDFLLQREILNKKLAILPDWLISSHVFHLNGSIEGTSQENRSPFLLETDSVTKRISTFEANRALSDIVWGDIFVVVGMSFNCEMDRGLLIYLQHHQDNLPFGEKNWYILNPDSGDLNKVKSFFETALPRANIVPVNASFQDWIGTGMPELVKQKILVSPGG